MKQHLVKIKLIKNITHDVLQVVTEKPKNYNFTPGQATEVAINRKGWENEKRPFTFTSLPDIDFLEFTIKTYPSQKSVTNKLLQLKINDELILQDVFGTIAYKGEGIFIAGGAGVTPYISILRYLQTKNEIGENKLIFANKKKNDIILEHEFQNLSDEKINGYMHGHITEDFLKANIGNFDQYFYICGPPPMIESIEKQLENLNVDKKHMVREEF